jgi:hypothetical protein
MSCNTFDSIGSKFSPRVLTPEQALQRVLTIDQRIAYDNDALARHDIALMRSSLNNFVINLPKGVYPIIADRQLVNPLTPTEFAEFVEWAGYTDTDIYEISLLPLPSDQVTTVYELLEYYLDENFAKRSTGNSCAGLVNKLSQIIGFLSAGAKLINELKNFSIAGVLARLNSWKLMLQKMVDELKERILAKINNFVNQIKSYAFKLQTAFGRFMKRVERVKQFLSDLSIQSIKDKIEEIIAKLAGQFEELTPEALAHLLMVICQLSDSITSFMQSPLDALKNMFNNYTAAEFGLKSLTDQNIAKSVQAGLPRITPETTDAVTTEVAASNGNLRNRVLSEDERLFLFELANSTSGTVTVGGVTIIHAPTPVADENAEPKRGGWTTVLKKGHHMIYVVAYRIAKAIGKPLTITSAYRSPIKNAELAKTTTGVAKDSLHVKGMALDISGVNLTPEERVFFIKLASREGVGGIGHYPRSNNKFTHIDLGDRRTWNEDISPAPIRTALYRHEQGKSIQFTAAESARLPGASYAPTSGVQ